MNSGQVLSLVFVILSTGLLLYLIFGTGRICKSKFRKFIIATSGVYLSGTLLIALLFFLIVDLSTVFVVISEAMILSVFLLCVFTIIRLGKTMDSINNESVKVSKTDEE